MEIDQDNRFGSYARTNNMASTSAMKRGGVVSPGTGVLDNRFRPQLKRQKTIDEKDEHNLTGGPPNYGYTSVQSTGAVYTIGGSSSSTAGSYAPSSTTAGANFSARSLDAAMRERTYQGAGSAGLHWFNASNSNNNSRRGSQERYHTRNYNPPPRAGVNNFGTYSSANGTHHDLPGAAPASPQRAGGRRSGGGTNGQHRGGSYNGGQHRAVSDLIGSIWDVCKAVESCDLENSEFAIDALAVPAVLGARGFHTIARAFGLTKLQPTWKESRLGQRRPTLISFRPGPASGGVRCVVYEDATLSSSSSSSASAKRMYPHTTGSSSSSSSGSSGRTKICREVTEQELEKFIAVENERCGDRVLIASPVRVEIITPEVRDEIQILDLPDYPAAGATGRRARTSSQFNIGAGAGGRPLHSQTGGHYPFSSQNANAFDHHSSEVNAWPGWVRKLCRGKPVILDQPASHAEQGKEYFLLPIPDLIYDIYGSSADGDADVNMGGGAGTRTDAQQDQIMHDLPAPDDPGANPLTTPRIADAGGAADADMKDVDGQDGNHGSSSKGGAVVANTVRKTSNVAIINGDQDDHDGGAADTALQSGQIFRPTKRVRFFSARDSLVAYLLAYHEKNFVNRVAPLWGKLMHSKLQNLDQQHREVLQLDRNIETTIILARNAGASVAACSSFLLDGSIRQNSFSAPSSGQGQYSSRGSSSPTVAGQTLLEELVQFGKDLEDEELTNYGNASEPVQLPDLRFQTWRQLGQYYESLSTANSEHFFSESLSGGAALARLLKECEASVHFAHPNLPNKMDEVLQYLNKELSQCGGVGLNQTTWQDVVTKIFQSTTHGVLQRQVSYVTKRLQWFLTREKFAIVNWMKTIKSSSDEPWYSRLYGQHGELLEKRNEIRKAVYEAYDDAIEKSCQAFQRIVQQMLSAIYNQPNAFIAKQTIKENDIDDVEEFTNYVLAYIQPNEETEHLPPQRKIILKLDPKCRLNITRQIVVDLTKKRKGTGYCCVVGRNPTLVTEHIDDLRISSTHFALCVHQGRMVLADMSSNGTFVTRADGLTTRVGRDSTAEIAIGERIGVLNGPSIPEEEHIWYTVEEYNPDGINQSTIMRGEQQNPNDMEDVSMVQIDPAMVRPVVLETDQRKRVRAAITRVQAEMDVKRKSMDSLSKLDRRFDQQEVEKYLPVAADHILSAFLQIKRWVATHVGLFAHAFLIKPLRNHLLEAMSHLTIKPSSKENISAEEQLWKEHAAHLNDIERQQHRIQEALDDLLFHQRSILRRGKQSFNI
ncbi:unnamed protein product [Amoebophrya sp. A120]|nr:unnamed protein product [Amoebophrya sp. A120]|eukprot:GSA120T00006460001.1